MEKLSQGITEYRGDMAPEDDGEEDKEEYGLTGRDLDCTCAIEVKTITM